MNWDGWIWTGGEEYNEKHKRLEIVLQCRGPDREYASVFIITDKMKGFDEKAYQQYLKNIVPSFIKIVKQKRKKDEKVQKHLDRHPYLFNRRLAV